MNDDVGQQENILLLIGELRTPIQKALRSKKQQIKAWIIDEKQGQVPEESDLLLRAYLSVGDRPTPQVLDASTIAHALQLDDILRHAKRLCLISQSIEAAALFEGLKTNLKELETPQQLPRLIRKARSAIEKWLQWVDSNHASLTEGTEKALLDIFVFLISQATPSKSMNGRMSKSGERTITPLLDLVFKVFKKSVYAGNLIRTMKEIEIVAKRCSSSFVENILESESGRQFLDHVLGSLPGFVRKAASEGRVDRLEDMVSGLNLIPRGDTTIQTAVRKIWEEERGRLSDEVQQFVHRYIEADQGMTPQPLTLSDASEDLRIPQVGTALLSSWEAHDDSPRAAESFRFLNEVAQKFFNLKICGSVGSVVDFDPKVHQFPNAPIGEGRVVIVRPWVEWAEGSRSKVIIRAIVEKPSDDGKEK